MSRLLTLFAGTCIATSWGAVPHALDVGWGEIGPQINVQAAEIAAFSPHPGEMWIVTPGRSPVSVSEAFRGRERWQVEELQVTGGRGVKLIGPAVGAWYVAGERGLWEVRLGKGKGSVRESASVTVFRDGRLAGDGVVMDAQAANGERFRVLATAGKTLAAGALNGWTPAFSGVVRAEHAVLSARVLPKDDLSVIQPSAGKRDVPFHAAESLPALATPVGDHRAVVEGVMPDLKDIYSPGEVREFTWPKGVRFENGKLIGLDMGAANQTRTRKIELARAVGAMGDATRKAEEVLAKTIPAKKPRQTGVSATIVPLDGDGVVEQDAKNLNPLGLPVAGGRKDYLPNLIVLQHRVALAKGELAKDEARRELAKFYLAWQRPHEAITMITMLPHAKNRQPREGDDRLVLAVAHLALGHTDEGLELLERMEPEWATHAAIWRTLAFQQQGRSAEALTVWPDRPKVVETYPPYLRKLVQNAVAEALLAVGDANQSLGYVGKLAKGYPADAVPQQVLRLQGLALLRANKGAEGLEVLAKASEEGMDMATAYRAKYEFVTALRQRREIDDKQLIQYLEELRLFWRGDDVEPRVLRDLAELYVKRKDYRQALARWRTLVRVYPNIPDMAYVTDRMSQTILSVFDAENPEVYDPLTYVGLFFDFRELLPADERGDRVAERVGKLLTETTLADRAVPVLEQTLRFGAKEQTDRARLSVLLARAYMVQGKPEDALKLLDSLGGDVPNTVLKQQAVMQTALALTELGRYDDALDTLKKAESDPFVRQLKVEALWRAERWQELRDILAGELSGLTSDELKGSHMRQLDLLRLGYALAALNQGAAILKLQERYADVLPGMPTVDDTLAAMSSMVGASPVAGDARPLSQVAGALSKLNTFGDEFRARQSLVKRSRAEQQEYNNRMKYMNILPPPQL